MTSARIALSTLLLIFSSACMDRMLAPVTPVSQSGVSITIANQGIDKVDLLVMMDNSNSMANNQSHIMAELGPMISQLTSPNCTSTSNPAQHTCNPSDPSDHPAYPAVRDMHVAIVSSDLGTIGSTVQGCANSDYGDDGEMNPIRNGASVTTHEPWAGGGIPSMTFGRPTDCDVANEYPSFISFSSGTTDPSSFTHDFECNAGLYVNGCALESQIESVYRSLIWYDSSDTPGNTSPNAGFLRADALLAILFITDEEDGSVRNTQYANNYPVQNPATDVYNSGSRAWGSGDLNLRFYLYQPGGPQDPTWPLDRYFNPQDATQGFPGLKPGHPERVVMAAITGVPLHGWQNADGSANWNALLGPPQNPSQPDDFIHRNDRDPMVIDTMSAEGPISMHQNNPNPHCSNLTVPACYREGTTYLPTACNYDVQYFAWPSRRIVELARRFDEDPICNGAPCHNGLVASICQNDYSAAISGVVQKIQSGITGQCLARPLAQQANVQGDLQVQCVVREKQPAGVDSCDATHGRLDPIDTSSSATGGTRTPSHVTVGTTTFRVCDVQQLPVAPADAGSGAGVPVDPTVHGWYYNSTPSTTGGTMCAQTITFTQGDDPGVGTLVSLECIQNESGEGDAGANGG